MDVIIPDSWLREFLKTAAKPDKIAEFLSLCGPSVERIEKIEGEPVYFIEVTTNRVDSAGVWGQAREAAAILPRFKIQAALLDLKLKASQNLVPQVNYLKADVDPTLCPRFTVILIRNVKYGPSPALAQKRLRQVGLRPLSNIVDISNYLMHELGQPVHTFDYDKIKGGIMKLRKSKKGEKITTLDGKTHTLPGEDIVIEDGSGRLIDLAGIMGGENSAVDENTKNVLLFVQTYNPLNIRRTSMSLGARSEAVSLFEKGLDPELVVPTVRRGIDLFIEWTGGMPEKEILDICPNPYKGKTIKTNAQFIYDRLGTKIDKKVITEFLKPLGFDVKWAGENLEVEIPSWRAQDMNIPEDIVEEVARIYGYHNLPSQLMDGSLPIPPVDAPFEFETKVKQILKGFGGTEIYTLSLVSEEMTYLGVQPLRLKNPLGENSAYLRTNLMPSLIFAAEENGQEKEPFHLFEMANVYLPKKGNLPEEKMMLGGIFKNCDYREAKGVIEALLAELHTNVNYEANGKSLIINKFVSDKMKAGEIIGKLEILDDNSIYYEFDMELLRETSSAFGSYTPITKYPAQIEDLSIVIPDHTYLGGVIEEIKKTDSQIKSVELIDIYDNSRTLRMTYQNQNKTLTDEEVAKIRSKVLANIQKKFGARIKI